MGKQKLLKMLGLCGEVISTRWNIVREIVSEINDNNVIILDKYWNDSYKNESDFYHLNLSKIDTWSTYDEKCIKLFFKTDNDNRLICEAKIYDGEILHGNRTGLRFTAKLVLPNNFINKISEYVEHGFEGFLEDQYQNHLELQKLEWKSNLRKSILNHKNK